MTITGLAGSTGVTAGNNSYRAESRVKDATVTAAIFGNIETGALLRFSVPDVGKASSYSAAVVEAADSTNTLRTNLGSYTLSVSK